MQQHNTRGHKINIYSYELIIKICRGDETKKEQDKKKKKEEDKDSEQSAKERKVAHMVPDILVLMWVFSSS